MTTADPNSQKLAEFPAPLRALIEAELEAGNTIVAIENGFPAAPCGASVKLAKAVHDERRRSTAEVSFYVRNNSSYAGEFTTAQRHYFVLEPPLPPEPPPDMDAIRRSLEPKPDVLSRLAQREARSGPEVVRSMMQERVAVEQAQPARIPKGAMTTTETATSAERLLHFRDHRPPHEIQFALERDLMSLFAATMQNDRLVLTASAKVVGAQYQFELRFEAAMPHTNCYSLHVGTSWADSAATHHDYYRKTANSWFGLWTRDLMPAEPPAADAGAPEQYQAICAAALNAEAHLDTVPALQQTIVAAMKRGARFTTSNKEGDTNMSWNGSRFVRIDQGDYPDTVVFPSEVEFLEALRKFYDWETSKNVYPEKVSDLVAWKLMLRLMRR
ncbi:MAG: hypothetical protein KA175_15895 [Flavobacteriales bacterium]|nr:hypothetical protein [Flavobacteriales bacterium]MBP6699104.1 hypothetical protein [Flavobacteriales bacterium]